MATLEEDDLNPNIRGLPAWELQCEEALRGMVACIETNAEREDICFDADFMAVFEAFLDQLLTWALADTGKPINKRAGAAVASLLKRLNDSRKELEKNAQFKSTYANLKELKNLTSSPTRRYAVEEIAKAARAHSMAEITAALPSAEGQQIWDAARFGGELSMYLEIGGFCAETAQQWFDKIIWPRLREREKEFLSEPEVQESQVYKSAEIKKGRAYLSDFKRQFRQATETLAKRPPGLMYGVNRPRW
jgi:hypothetical protein